MKAGTLVIMLLIGMMSYTGFGNTTADPTENSQAELVQMDDLVSVVILDVDQDILTVEEAALDNLIFQDDVLSAKAFTNSTAFFCSYLQPTDFYNDHNFRKARDGIRLDKENELSPFHEDTGGSLSLFYI